MSSRGGEDGPEIHWVKDYESATYFADYYSILNGSSQFFVIGGAHMYGLFEGWFNKIYLTEVFSGEIEGDAFFKYEFDQPQWRTTDEAEFPADDQNEFPFRIRVLQRREKLRRTRLPSELLTPDAETARWMDRFGGEVENIKSEISERIKQLSFETA